MNAEYSRLLGQFLYCLISFFEEPYTALSTHFGVLVSACNFVCFCHVSKRNQTQHLISIQNCLLCYFFLPTQFHVLLCR